MGGRGGGWYVCGVERVYPYFPAPIKSVFGARVPFTSPLERDPPLDPFRRSKSLEDGPIGTPCFIQHFKPVSLHIPLVFYKEESGGSKDDVLSVPFLSGPTKSVTVTNRLWRWCVRDLRRNGLSHTLWFIFLPVIGPHLKSKIIFIFKISTPYIQGKIECIGQLC